ncbi:MAG: hypothetical protein WAM53_03615 [Terrimicrobiaceae bacterium]
MSLPENIRTGLSTDEIKQAFRDNLCCGMGQLEVAATKHDLYVALALAVRDRLFQRTVVSMAGRTHAASPICRRSTCRDLILRTTCSISG